MVLQCHLLMPALPPHNKKADVSKNLKIRGSSEKKGNREAHSKENIKKETQRRESKNKQALRELADSNQN